MKKLIIFDMDGVLVDVSASYRDTVRKTAHLFLSCAAGGENLPDPMFSLEDLSAVKQSGGLNNDWDLTHRVVTLLMSRVDACGTNNRAEWDLSALNAFLKTAESPLSDLLASVSSFRSEYADYYYRNDVGSGNIIKQIFQEVYLGEELFRETYGMGAEFFHDEGYILREKLFIDPEVISKWASGNVLAVATGRPRSEALYPLKKHKIDYFKIIYTLDECLAAEKEAEAKGEKNVSYSKPDPFMLDKIAEEIMHDEKSNDFEALYYVGDMPDDMTAANRSSHGFKGIAVLYSAPDKKGSLLRLKNAGASVIAETPEELDILFK